MLPGFLSALEGGADDPDAEDSDRDTPRARRAAVHDGIAPGQAARDSSHRELEGSTVS